MSKSKRKNKGKRKEKVLSKILINLMVCIILIPVFICIFIFSVAHVYKLNLYKEINLETKINTIMDRKNYTKSDDISKCFLNAVTSVEDHRFYKHNGFDVISFSRAMLTNIETGKYSQGGSTITQQLAKNLYLTSSKNFFRKAIELLIALDIERNYEKKEILELYVNVIYYGKDSYGVYNASKMFFNKLPNELTHNESAYLAGLTQSPTAYSTNTVLGNERKDIVLDAMVKYSTCEHNKVS